VILLPLHADLSRILPLGDLASGQQDGVGARIKLSEWLAGRGTGRERELLT